LEEDIIARILFSRKLGEEGGEEAIAVLLLVIPKIEIIIRHCGQSGCTQTLDFLNDRGTVERNE